MTQTFQEIENTFAEAWTLLAKNPIIVLPGVVLGFLGAALAIAIAMLVLGTAVLGGVTGNTTATTLSIVATAAVAVVTVLLMVILQMAFVTGMAGAAWDHGTTTLADGWAAFTHRGWQIFTAVVMLFLIGCVAAVLAIPTLFLALLAFAVFFIYVMAAVIIGGRDAAPAIGESCRLAAHNFLPTLGVIAIVFVISLLGAWAGAVAGHLTPLVGGIVSAVIQQIIVAYATLVIAGEYINLRRREAAAVASAPVG